MKTSWRNLNKDEKITKEFDKIRKNHGIIDNGRKWRGRIRKRMTLDGRNI